MKGPYSERSLSKRFQILKEVLIIGFMEYLDTGSERSIFIQSRAGNDVWLHTYSLAAAIPGCQKG